MATEAAANIVDLVTAELVDCTPEHEPVAVTPLPESPDQTPTQRIRDASVSQVGADPPPEVNHG